MSTAFARQLQTIAVKSTNELDLRARRNAHGESLIFPRDVAVKQDWHTVFQICIEGFYELCQLDTRFRHFEQNLFSEESKDQDRDKLSKSQNEQLDSVIEQCLLLLGPRLVLRPGVKCLEWLVRRFKIHMHNVSTFLCTVLPYHEEKLWVNVVSIVPKEKLIDALKWVRPYREVNQNVPRHTVVHAMTSNDAFFNIYNQYALQTAENGYGEKGVFRYWGGIVVEAVSARINQAKSGRKEIQRQKTEDVLLKVLPVLDSGLSISSAPELVVSCFALCLVMASTGLLQDNVLDRMMEAASGTLRYRDMKQEQVLVTLVILAAQKEQDTVPSRVFREVTQTKELFNALKDLRPRYPIQILLRSLLRASLDLIKQKNVEHRLAFLETVLQNGPQLTDQAELVKWIVIVVLISSR